MNFPASVYPRYVSAALIVLAGLIWFAGAGGKQNAAARFDVPEVSIAHAKAMIDAGALIIDVRGQAVSEYRHIPGALLIPLSVLRAGSPPLPAAAKSKPIVVYCGDGVKTGPEATHILRQAGYTNAVNMTRGYEGWHGAKLPLAKG